VCALPGRQQRDEQGSAAADAVASNYSPRRPSRATSSSATAWIDCMAADTHKDACPGGQRRRGCGRKTALSPAAVCVLLRCARRPGASHVGPAKASGPPLCSCSTFNTTPTSSSPFNSRPTRADFLLLGQRHRGTVWWRHAACHAARGQSYG
jgi:hypothetical protein